MAELFRWMPRGTVLDGEIVRWVDWKLDFEAVQRRYRHRRRGRELAETEPAILVAFDVLEARGADQRLRPLTARRQILEDLFRRVPAASSLALSMHTGDYQTALTWYEHLPAVGVEGVVAKPARSRYQAGQRGWLKCKSRPNRP